MLRGKGLTRHITVPVSAGLLTGAEGYFQALSDYRDGNPDPINLTFADASLTAVGNGRKLVDDLDGVRQA